jgi:hypothetical protein
MNTPNILEYNIFELKLKQIVPLPRDHLMDSHGKWDDCDLALMIMMIIKQGRFKCLKCMNNKDALYDVLTCCTKFLKYDSS